MFASFAVLARATVRKVSRKPQPPPSEPLIVPKASSKSKTKPTLQPKLPKTWKLPGQERVAFNLNKLSSLSGHDKIDLFKDYVRTHSRKEAIHVYEKLIEIGLTNRLEYKDFHNLFRLLLSNPQEYRKVIVTIRNEIVTNGNVPTVYFDNEYMSCLVKWGNIKDARALLDELCENEKKVNGHSYELFLEYYLERKRFEEGREVVKIMNEARPLTRPSLGVYLKSMAIYTGLGDADACKEVYLDGEENLERLYVNHLEATSQAEDLRWNADSRIQLFNAYINCLSTVKEYDQVMNLYKEFKDEGWLVKSKSSANTFHIIFKAIHSVIQDGGRVYDEKELDGYWGDLVRVCSPDYLHYARYMTLVKSVAVLDEIYRNACLTLNIAVDGSKRQAVESAYLTSIVDFNFKRGMEEMERVRKSQTRKPMRFVYAKFLRLAKENGAEDDIQIWIQKDKIEIPVTKL